MSSPIHHAEDLDAALVYAPPWARKQASLLRQAPTAPRDVPLAQYQRSEFSGDRAMLELQRRLTLDPGAVPEPPFEGEQTMWPLALRLCAVTGVAALVAWAVVSLPAARKPAAQAVQADMPAVVPVNRVKLMHVQSPPDPAAVGRAGFTEAPPAPAAETLTAAAIPPSAPPAASAALDNEEIAAFVQRGHDLLQNGDLVSARLLLQRAAETGSAAAAFALGATYDPLVIKKLGVIGLQPDAARARAWYAAAAQLGSADAAQRLAILEREP